ncbi:MAG: hypothetical protein ACJ8FN_11530 [Sphingomicrobium sp.]
MKKQIAAALALLVAAPAAAQDLSTAMPIAGNWTYTTAADGSGAVFADTSGTPQLWVRCTRATRRVTISKAATVTAPSINVWTSSQAKSVASSFNAATGRLTIDLANYDPLLDAIVSSRGRVGFSVGSQPPLVVPPWAEVARVIEDCRA